MAMLNNQRVHVHKKTNGWSTKLTIQLVSLDLFRTPPWNIPIVVTLAESSDFLPDVPYFVYGIYYLVMISLVFFGTYPTFMSYDIMIYPAIHIYIWSM